MQVNSIGNNYGYQNQRIQKNNNQTTFGQLLPNEAHLAKLNEHLFETPASLRINQQLHDAAVEGFETVMGRIADKWRDVTCGVQKRDVRLSITKNSEVSNGFRVKAESFADNEVDPAAGVYPINDIENIDFAGIDPTIGREYGEGVGNILSAAIDKVIGELRKKVPQNNIEASVKRQVAMFAPRPTEASTAATEGGERLLPDVTRTRRS